MTGDNLRHKLLQRHADNLHRWGFNDQMRVNEISEMAKMPTLEIEHEVRLAEVFEDNLSAMQQMAWHNNYMEKIRFTARRPY